jgi:hypothetical protein
VRTKRGDTRHPNKAIPILLSGVSDRLAIGVSRDDEPSQVIVKPRGRSLGRE